MICSPSLRAAGPGRAERSCCPELPALGWAADASCSLGGRTGLASIPESCVCSRRAASPSGASAAAGAVPAASTGSLHPTARLLCREPSLPLPPAAAGTGWCDLRAMGVGKQPLLPPAQPPSFPSGASLCWAVLDASGALAAPFSKLLSPC